MRNEVLDVGKLSRHKFLSAQFDHRLVKPICQAPLNESVQEMRKRLRLQVGFLTGKLTVPQPLCNPIRRTGIQPNPKIACPSPSQAFLAVSSAMPIVESTTTHLSIIAESTRFGR